MPSKRRGPKALQHGDQPAAGTMGYMMWMLNSPYPTMTWGAIDVTGKWKVAQHAVARASASVLLSAAIYRRKHGLLVVHLANDRASALTGAVASPTKMTDASGNTITSGSHGLAQLLDSTAPGRLVNGLATLPMQPHSSKGAHGPSQSSAKRSTAQERLQSPAVTKSRPSWRNTDQ